MVMNSSLQNVFHTRAQYSLSKNVSTSISAARKPGLNERVVDLGLSFGIMTLEGFGNEMKQSVIFGCNVLLVCGNLYHVNDDYVCLH